MDKVRNHRSVRTPGNVAHPPMTTGQAPATPSSGMAPTRLGLGPQNGAEPARSATDQVLGFWASLFAIGRQVIRMHQEWTRLALAPWSSASMMPWPGGSSARVHEAARADDDSGRVETDAAPKPQQRPPAESGHAAPKAHQPVAESGHAASKRQQRVVAESGRREVDTARKPRRRPATRALAKTKAGTGKRASAKTRKHGRPKKRSA